MRYLVTGTAVLTLLVCACSKRSDSTATAGDDLKKDPALTNSASTALATPPMNYKRMRFVSDLEMSRSTVKAKQPKVSKHHDRMAPSVEPGPVTNNAAVQEVVEVASAAPSPVATAEVLTRTPEDTMTFEGRGITPGSSSTSATTGAGVARSHGSGWGGLIGAVMGNVVIRGGQGDDDKCDPRTDRGRGRPNFAMPLGGGRTSFPHHIYR